MKNKAAIYYFLLLTGLLPIDLVAQNNPTFTLNGRINNSNNISFGATTAGENPATLHLFNENNSTNNTSMYLRYRWPFWGTDENNEETYLMGSIKVVSSASIPSGLQWSIQAAEVSSTYGQYGLSKGPQVLGTVKATLIYEIWSTASGWFPFVSFLAANINSTLTQVLSVTNFADLHPTPNGNFQTFVVTYTLE